MVCTWLLHTCWWALSKCWAMPGGRSAGRLRGRPLVGARAHRRRPLLLRGQKSFLCLCFWNPASSWTLAWGEPVCRWCQGPLDAVGPGVKAQLRFRQLVSCLMFLFFLLTLSQAISSHSKGSQPTHFGSSLCFPFSQSGHTFLDLTPWHQHACLALVFIPACTHMCPQRTRVQLCFPLVFCAIHFVSQLHCHMWVMMTKSTVGGVWGDMRVQFVSAMGCVRGRKCNSVFWGKAIHVLVSSEGAGGHSCLSASLSGLPVPSPGPVVSGFLLLLRCGPFPCLGVLTAFLPPTPSEAHVHRVGATKCSSAVVFSVCSLPASPSTHGR